MKKCVQDTNFSPTEYAQAWEAPTGAHDMYKDGEYMIWTDGTIKKCLRDTNFSPEEYPADWEDA